MDHRKAHEAKVKAERHTRLLSRLRLILEFCTAHKIKAVSLKNGIKYTSGDNFVVWYPSANTVVLNGEPFKGVNGKGQPLRVIQALERMIA